jgi:hypothetical protein
MSGSAERHLSQIGGRRMNAGDHVVCIQRQRRGNMTKVATIALMAVSLIALSGAPASAFSETTLSKGERDARHLMHLMDKDHNGQVSKAEFMQFMEQEFDRLDRDRSGQLNSEEFSRTGLHYSHKTTVSRK